MLEAFIAESRLGVVWTEQCSCVNYVKWGYDRFFLRSWGKPFFTANHNVTSFCQKIDPNLDSILPDFRFHIYLEIKLKLTTTIALSCLVSFCTCILINLIAFSSSILISSLWTRALSLLWTGVQLSERLKLLRQNEKWWRNTNSAFFGFRLNIIFIDKSTSV